MKSKNMNIIIWCLIIIFAAGWSIYNEKRIKSPVVNQGVAEDQNQSVIDNLIKHGSNPEKDHQIEFAFYGNLESINKLKDEMSASGYRYDAGLSEKDENGDQWLTMVKSHKLHIDELKKEFSKMKDFANKYGVEYDGWSTAIVR